MYKEDEDRVADFLTGCPIELPLSLKEMKEFKSLGIGLPKTTQELYYKAGEKEYIVCKQLVGQVLIQFFVGFWRAKKHTIIEGDATIMPREEN